MSTWCPQRRSPPYESLCTITFRTPIEVSMAKKKSIPAKSSVATQTRKPSKSKTSPSKLSNGKQANGKPAKRAPKQTRTSTTIRTNAARSSNWTPREHKAIDLVVDSEAVRTSLETEVNTVVTLAVRKICKATRGFADHRPGPERGPGAFWRLTSHASLRRLPTLLQTFSGARAG